MGPLNVARHGTFLILRFQNLSNFTDESRLYSRTPSRIPLTRNDLLGNEYHEALMFPEAPIMDFMSIDSSYYNTLLTNLY